MQLDVFVPLFGGICEHVTLHDVEAQKSHLSNTRCGNLSTYTAFSILIYLCTFSFLTLSFPFFALKTLKILLQLLMVC